jgi:hypothetical protein
VSNDVTGRPLYPWEQPPSRSVEPDATAYEAAAPVEAVEAEEPIHGEAALDDVKHLLDES